MGGVIGGNHQGIKSLKTASASVGRALLYISQSCFLLLRSPSRVESEDKNVARIAMRGNVGTIQFNAASTQSFALTTVQVDSFSSF